MRCFCPYMFSKPFFILQFSLFSFSVVCILNVALARLLSWRRMDLGSNPFYKRFISNFCFFMGFGQHRFFYCVRHYHRSAFQLAKKLKGMEVAWGQGLSYSLVHEFHNTHLPALAGNANSTVVDQIFSYIYSGTNNMLSYLKIISWYSGSSLRVAIYSTNCVVIVFLEISSCFLAIT